MKEVNTEVFIGGVADGRREAVLDSRYIVRLRDGDQFRMSTYRLERLATSKVIFSFWLSDDMTMEDAMERLFDVYPAERI